MIRARETDRDTGDLLGEAHNLAHPLWAGSAGSQPRSNARRAAAGADGAVRPPCPSAVQVGFDGADADMEQWGPSAEAFAPELLTAGNGHPLAVVTHPRRGCPQALTGPKETDGDG